MDILTHMISGIAAGTVVASYSGRDIAYKTGILLTSAAGGIIPDLDVFSLWSEFDGRIGIHFGLSKGENVYYAQYWYSHHGFFHSLFAALFIPVLLFTIIYLLKKPLRRSPDPGLKSCFKKNALILLAISAAYIIHLLEDMPTPGYTWGGINFFWPSAHYTGGSGHIWWWNNYDLFLIISGVVLVNLILLIAGNARIKNLIPIVFSLGVIFSLVQINSRNIDFNYTSYRKDYQQLELKSKEVQKQILGEQLYSWMDNFDKKVPFNF
ncbi:metal-dependent hydrolase [Saccharicrinis sp. FJH54]|uniref:metal-dependent hydrolase n=1 Tax=Saccharicrinis sp. FJH54 TaxID=3344665 RepID=UPI0035D4BD3C